MPVFNGVSWCMVNMATNMAARLTHRMAALVPIIVAISPFIPDEDLCVVES